MPTLDWLNRAQAFTTAAQVPYRLLDNVSTHGEPQAAAGNLLIQGDNLEALKALLPFYRGQVKCIFIDPPYNTKSAFEHYDDNLEHSQWLSMMLPRLQLLRDLLSEDGSIWVSIDDNEGHYLKVLMDEVFGRRNFVANALWQKVYSERMDAVGFSADHDHLLCYRKSEKFKVGRLEKSQNAAQFRLIDELTGQPYRRRSLRKEGSESLRADRPSMWYPIIAPDGSRVFPVKPDGTEGRWRWMASTYETSKDAIEWVKVKGIWEIYVKQFLDIDATRPPSTFWTNEEVGHNHEAKLEARIFNKQDTFDTPKPERLLQRILHIASNPGDLVLDSFLGSGTTAAVAHKMGRRWIGIEMGEHAATHCLPRLQKVIDGEQGGISAAVGWQGGGGFRYVTLGAPIFDADGCIHPNVRFATLAAFIWQQETHTAFDPAHATPDTPHLGTHSVFDSCYRTPYKGLEPISPEIDVPAPEPILRSRTAYYLLFNGILGDKRPASGNVLTCAVLDALLALHATTAHPDAPLVVYGEANRLGDARLALARVTFKHIPYDVKAR